MGVAAGFDAAIFDCKLVLDSRLRALYKYCSRGDDWTEPSGLFACERGISLWLRDFEIAS